MVVTGDLRARTLDGVAGAARIVLFDEANAGIGHCLPHPLRLVAHHHINIARGHDLAGGGNHMAEQRFAANFMQRLGPARMQPN